MPAFTGGGGINISNNPSLPSIALPVFSSSNSINGNYNDNVNIGNNTILTSISLPALTSTSFINIVYNPLLTSISLPALTTSSKIYLSSNALTTSNINALLNKMLTVSPTIAKQIELYAQTPPAPPSGQGIIDKQTLINAGNYVFTD